MRVHVHKPGKEGGVTQVHHPAGKPFGEQANSPDKAPLDEHRTTVDQLAGANEDAASPDG
jgi:hypothetical protein